MTQFDPNRISLAACIARIEQEQEKVGIANKPIITSQDDEIRKLHDEMRVTNIPGGFEKNRLPVFLDKASTMYISRGSPNTVVPRHAHEEGAGMRFIIDGSIEFDGRKLGQGDWMFMRPGAVYEFTVGPQGVVMCYCYSCCCA